VGDCTQDLPLSKEATTELNTELKGEAGQEQVDKLREGIIELSQQFNTGLKLKDIPDAMADFGKITPWEAYMAVLVNKELGIAIPHARGLIQHGSENRSPFDPSVLGNINHVGYVGDTPLSVQTHSEKELVHLVATTKGYGDSNIIDLHRGWDAELWKPVIDKQKEVRAEVGFVPLPDQIPKEKPQEKPEVTTPRMGH
jgi:hypothetical protein